MRAFQIVIDRRPPRTAPRDFAAIHGVVDVLVDGTNVTARIGQDHALPLLRDLAYATYDLASERQFRCTVRFYDQRDAWALGLERVADTVLLTVFQAGACPKVAVFERPVQGEALLRGIQQALDEVLKDPSAPAAVVSDLAAARRMLASQSWQPSGEEVSVTEARVEGSAEAPISFSTDFTLRTRTPRPSRDSEVERNDLHPLLFRGPFRIRAGDARRDVGECHPFLVTEVLVREAAKILECWEMGRPMLHRSETAGVFFTARLTSDGTLSISLGGPRTAGLHNASTFPCVSVPSFVEAVISLARGVTRPVVRHDRSQHNNLRVRVLREAVRDLAEALREAVRQGDKYNDAPETYRAFAVATELAAPAPEPDKSCWGHGRMRFTSSWQASVPGIDLQATFLFGDRLVVGGTRELACIDRHQGCLLWRAPVERGVCIAAPNGVVRLSPSGVLTMHDLETGEVSLHVRVAARTSGTPAGAVVNSPGLPRLVIVSEGDRHITAVDIVSGEIRWRHALGRGRSFKVRRAGRLLIVSSSEQHLTAIDVATGEAVWRVKDRLRYCRPAAYEGNDLFIVAGDALPTGRGSEVLQALDPWSGVLRWKQPLPAAQRSIGAPVVVSDRVVVPVCDQRGTGFVAYERESGKPLWHVAPGCVQTAAWLAVDNVLVINGDKGQALGLRLEDGSVCWRRSFGRAAEGDVPRQLDPVLRAGALFLPQQAVHVVRPHDGDTIGQVPTDLVPDALRVDDDCNVVVVEESGHLAAFSAAARLTLVKA